MVTFASLYLFPTWPWHRSLRNFFPLWLLMYNRAGSIVPSLASKRDGLFLFPLRQKVPWLDTKFSTRFAYKVTQFIFSDFYPSHVGRTSFSFRYSVPYIRRPGRVYNVAFFTRFSFHSPTVFVFFFYPSTSPSLAPISGDRRSLLHLGLLFALSHM